MIGVTCLYSMIYLPAYLHLCESAEALGSGVACYRITGYPELRSLLLILHRTLLELNCFSAGYEWREDISIIAGT